MTERPVSRRSFLAAVPPALLAGCSAESRQSDQDHCDNEYDAPLSNDAFRSLSVGWVNPGRSEAVWKLWVGVKPTATNRHLDVLRDGDRLGTAAVVPNADEVAVNFKCYRKSVMDGCLGAPTGTYLLQLRRDGRVEAHTTVRLYWDSERNCYQIDPADSQEEREVLADD